jgi:hypothetical protein
VDYSQLIKIYTGVTEGPTRYSPGKLQGTIMEPLIGNPNRELICTSHVERTNLTVRMRMRRMTRLTNAFSRKWDNLKAAVALFVFSYNFREIHRSIRCTPAMEAGVATSIWTWLIYLPTNLRRYIISGMSIHNAAAYLEEAVNIMATSSKELRRRFACAHTQALVNINPEKDLSGELLTRFNLLTERLNSNTLVIPPEGTIQATLRVMSDHEVKDTARQLTVLTHDVVQEAARQEFARQERSRGRS